MKFFYHYYQSRAALPGSYPAEYAVRSNTGWIAKRFTSEADAKAYAEQRNAE